MSKKLQRRENSKRSLEQFDRGFCRVMGQKYPIIPARLTKRIAERMNAEFLSEVCPN